METAFDKISPLIPFSLFVLVICSILALGFLSSQGFERFYTLPFWSVLGPAMAIGVLLGGFVGIMAAAAPTVSNGSMTLTLVGASVFLLITWIGIFPAYFLLQPESLILRILIGGIAAPVATATVGGILVDVADSLFGKPAQTVRYRLEEVPLEEYQKKVIINKPDSEKFVPEFSLKKNFVYPQSLLEDIKEKGFPSDDFKAMKHEMHRQRPIDGGMLYSWITPTTGSGEYFYVCADGEKDCLVTLVPGIVNVQIIGIEKFKN